MRECHEKQNPGYFERPGKNERKSALAWTGDKFFRIAVEIG